MNAARISGLSAILAGLLLKPICLVAASVPNFPPDPVGEKLYRVHVYHQALFLVAIIACALLAAFLVHKKVHRNEELDPRRGSESRT